MKTLFIFASCIFALAYAQTTPSPTTALKQFKMVIRTNIKGLFGKVDENHNNEFDKDDMKHIFTEYDTNMDKQVTEMEFTGKFAKNEPGLTIIGKGIFLELDMDKSGAVTDSDLPLYFNKIDQNKDGKVAEVEFEDYFTELFTILYVLKLKAEGTVG